MKKIILSLYFFSFVLCDEYQNLFNKANQAMFDGEYNNAIQLYEKIIELDYKSSEAFYNLGNAYYRSNFIGLAIWSYMKASKLAPRNSDIKYNLSIAKAKRLDRIQMPETFFILKYYRAIKHFFTFNEWIFLGSLFLLCNSTVFFIKKIGYFEGKIITSLISVLIVSTIMVHLIVVDKYLQEKKTDLAVIVENNVDAYSEPFYGNKTILFKINEGSIMDISERQKDWVKIILIDGKTGWLTSRSIRKL